MGKKERINKKREKQVRAEQASYNDSLMQKVTDLLRLNNMQEFVEVPNEREMILLTDKAVSELNMINPATPNLLLSIWESTPDSENLLVKMLTCEVVDLILHDYAHKGIEAHSIEDIQVSDRATRYEAMKERCDKEGLIKDVSSFKTAKGIGVNTDTEGLAMGVVHRVPGRGYNDFSFSLGGRAGRVGKCGVTLIAW